jgi:hypothetical protein
MRNFIIFILYQIKSGRMRYEEHVARTREVTAITAENPEGNNLLRSGTR